MKRLIFIAIALALASSASAAPREFTRSGKIRADANAEHAATLRLACSPEPNGGTLSIELIVPEAHTRKDFDYDDFEGPDAPASTKALSALAWSTRTGTTTIEHAAAGWYLSDAFNFGINQPTHQRKEPARLLNAIRDESGQLTWTQTSFDNAGHRLVARFDLDASAAQQLHVAVAECLPQNMPMRKPRE